MKISNLSKLLILSAFLVNFSSFAIAADDASKKSAKSNCLTDISKQCFEKCDAMEATAKRQCNKECRTKLSKEEKICMKKNKKHNHNKTSDAKDATPAATDATVIK